MSADRVTAGAPCRPTDNISGAAVVHVVRHCVTCLATSSLTHEPSYPMLMCDDDAPENKSQLSGMISPWMLVWACNHFNHKSICRHTQNTNISDRTITGISFMQFPKSPRWPNPYRNRFDLVPYQHTAALLDAIWEEVPWRAIGSQHVPHVPCVVRRTMPFTRFSLEIVERGRRQSSSARSQWDQSPIGLQSESHSTRCQESESPSPAAELHTRAEWLRGWSRRWGWCMFSEDCLHEQSGSCSWSSCGWGRCGCVTRCSRRCSWGRSNGGECSRSERSGGEWSGAIHKFTLLQPCNYHIHSKGYIDQSIHQGNKTD